MSKKIGLFYGTTTGKTEAVAEAIRDAFGDVAIDYNDISQADIEDLNQYDYLIIGSPTWDIGELQSDWESVFSDLDDIDFTGKVVAYFGTGDQFGYSDSFQDAMGILEEKITELGGQTVGYTDIEGYDFNESKAVRDGKFCGLALDDDNQPELTEARILAWVAQLKNEFGL